MIPFEWYWAVFTVIAAAAQTVRNATQRRLSGSVGTLGATQVRFLYGLPFALVFFAIAVSVLGPPPRPDPVFYAWTGFGALAQIAATALLIAAMQLRNFSVAIAYANTEPIQLAVFGLVVLGDPLTFGLAISVLGVTLGIMLMSWPPAGARLEARPVALGVLAGGVFALSAVGYRGGIQSLGGSFVLAASTTLVTALLLQTIVMSAYMAARRPAVLRAVLRAWRPSLLAGFAGAFASQMWFFAFALENAARVRTLGVVEILFAQLVSARIFKEGASARELVGLALVIASVVIVLNA